MTLKIHTVLAYAISIFSLLFAHLIPLWVHWNRRATDHYTTIRWLVHWPLMGGLLYLPQREGLEVRVDVYHGTAPVYMTDMCSRCSDDRLRSSARRNFLVRRTRTRFANSSLTVAGPAAWNPLPAHIRTINSHSAFCRHLKTYLFTVFDWLSLTVGLYLHMYT